MATRVLDGQPGNRRGKDEKQGISAWSAKALKSSGGSAPAKGIAGRIWFAT